MSKDPYEKCFDDTFRFCIEIVKFYSCPEECEGSCCRNDNITFSQKEYRTIHYKCPSARLALSSKTKISVDTVGSEHIETYAFTERPCPLLTAAARCSIQEAKPFICRMYPFAIGKAPDRSMIAIDPCPIGLEMMKDYVLFKAVVLANGTGFIDPDNELIVNEDIQRLKEIIDHSSEFHDKKKIPMMYVPLSIAEDIVFFLKETTREDRLHDRRELGID